MQFFHRLHVFAVSTTSNQPSKNGYGLVRTDYEARTPTRTR